MTNKNIVLFSSGVSEQNGILASMVAALERKGYSCAYWRDLFAGANDADHIALLPILIKKIPSFDYAVLICEGHDVTTIYRNGEAQQVCTMRDNVLFEIGLCAMALGLSRTILLTDAVVHMPDDLTGVGQTLALKRIIYKENAPDAAAAAVMDYMQAAEDASDEIDQHIRTTGDVLTPVVVGASCSTACGYVNNFIFRSLEHITDGIETDEGILLVRPEQVYVHIRIPQEATVGKIKLPEQLQRGCVRTARSRPAYFQFYRAGEEIHIVDVPTTIGTSYDTARMILEMDADDKEDADAAKRYVTKEMNLFESTVRMLLTQRYLRQCLEENGANPDCVPMVMDIVENRLSLERIHVDN